MKLLLSTLASRTLLNLPTDLSVIFQRREFLSSCGEQVLPRSTNIAARGVSSPGNWKGASCRVGRNGGCESYSRISNTTIIPSFTSSVAGISRPMFRLSSERSFSIRGKNRKGRGRPKGGNQGPLTNEHLVSDLLRRGDGKSADSVQVRLVVDRGAGNPSDIDIVSLVAAIEKSQELGVDLVAINLDQEIPVIKAADLNKLKYEQSKKSGPSSSSTSKQLKEFKFKAGIDDNDLQRKVENLAKYLDKGHTCKITITSNRKNLMRDKEAVVTTLNRVREIVGDRAVEPRALRGNEQGTHAVITFQPNPKTRTKK